MIEGIYTFKENGNILATSRNLVTTAGRIVILNFLAKNSTSIAGAIAIGSGITAATVNDITLGFEYARADINLVTPDFSTAGIVFKAILPASVAGTVYEAGLWSNAGLLSSGGSTMLSSFDASSETWSTGTFTTDATKIGGDSLRVSAPASTTVTTTQTGNVYDLSGYTSADNILFAYNVNDAFNASIKLRFKTDNTNYYEVTITTPTAGYHVASFTKSSFSTTGAPSWANITMLEIASTATSGATSVVDLDGLKVEIIPTSPDAILVSRTVLVTPLPKSNTRPMELEYRLRVTV